MGDDRLFKVEAWKPSDGVGNGRTFYVVAESYAAALLWVGGRVKDGTIPGLEASSFIKVEKVGAAPENAA